MSSWYGKWVEGITIPLQKRLAHFIFNRALGKYFHQIEQEQIELNVSSGVFCVKGLKFIDTSDFVPGISVLSGSSVGTVYISFPWKSKLNQSTVIRMSELELKVELDKSKIFQNNKGTESSPSNSELLSSLITDSFLYKEEEEEDHHFISLNKEILAIQKEEPKDSSSEEYIQLGLERLLSSLEIIIEKVKVCVSIGISNGEEFTLNLDILGGVVFKNYKEKSKESYILNISEEIKVSLNHLKKKEEEINEVMLFSGSCKFRETDSLVLLLFSDEEEKLKVNVNIEYLKLEQKSFFQRDNLIEIFKKLIFLEGNEEKIEIVPITIGDMGESMFVDSKDEEEDSSFGTPREKFHEISESQLFNTGHANDDDLFESIVEDYDDNDDDFHDFKEPETVKEQKKLGSSIKKKKYAPLLLELYCKIKNIYLQLQYENEENEKFGLGIKNFIFTASEKKREKKREVEVELEKLKVYESISSQENVILEFKKGKLDKDVNIKFTDTEEEQIIKVFLSEIEAKFDFLFLERIFKRVLQFYIKIFDNKIPQENEKIEESFLVEEKKTEKNILIDFELGGLFLAFPADNDYLSHSAFFLRLGKIEYLKNTDQQHDEVTIASVHLEVLKEDQTDQIIKINDQIKIIIEGEEEKEKKESLIRSPSDYLKNKEVFNEEDPWKLKRGIDIQVSNSKCLKESKKKIILELKKAEVMIKDDDQKKWLINEVASYYQNRIQEIFEIQKKENAKKERKQYPFFQDKNCFFFEQRKIEECLTPDMGVHVIINEIQVNVTKNYQIKLDDFQVYLFTYQTGNGSLDLIKLNLNSRNMSVFEINETSEEGLVFGDTTLIKKYRQKFLQNVLNVDLLFKTDKHLNMTNTMLKINIGGFYIKINKKLLKLIEVITQLLVIKLPDATTDDAIVSLYLLLNDTTADYSPANNGASKTGERLIVSLDTLKVHFEMTQEDPFQFKTEVFTSELNLLCHNKCKLNLLTNKNDGTGVSLLGVNKFGFINGLTRLGFVKIGFVNSINLDCSFLKDEYVPMKIKKSKNMTKSLSIEQEKIRMIMEDNPKIKVLITDGLVTFTTCYDSIHTVLLIANSFEKLLNKVNVEEESKESLEEETKKKVLQKTEEKKKDEDEDEESLESDYLLGSQQFETLKYNDVSVIVYPSYYQMKVFENYLDDPKQAQRIKDLEQRRNFKDSPRRNNKIHEIDLSMKNTNIIVNLYDGKDFPNIMSEFEEEYKIVDSETKEPKKEEKEDEDEDESDETPRDLSTFVEIKLLGIDFNLNTFNENDIIDVEFKMRDIKVYDRLKSSNRNIMFGYYQGNKHRLESASMVDVFYRTQKMKNGKTANTLRVGILPMRINLHQKAVKFLLFYCLKFLTPKKAMDKTTSNSSLTPSTPLEKEEDTKAQKKELVEDQSDEIKSVEQKDEEEECNIIFRLFELSDIKFKIDYQGSNEFSYKLLSSKENKLLTTSLEGMSPILKNFIDKLLNFSSLKDISMKIDSFSARNVSQIEFAESLTGHIFSQIRSVEQIFRLSMSLLPVKGVYSVGSGFVDIFVIPVREYYKGDEGSVLRGIRRGFFSFSKRITKETVGVSASLTGGVGKSVKSISRAISDEHNPQHGGNMPANLKEGFSGMKTSLKTGFSEPIYAFVAIPRSYSRKGTLGAAKSTLKAIPLAILSPIGGITEAMSKLMHGFNNTYFPELKREHDEKYK